MIELRSDKFAPYAQTNGTGRFYFDGLSSGDYQVSAYAEGYPMNRRLLVGPQKIQIKESSCAHRVLVVPPEK